MAVKVEYNNKQFAKDEEISVGGICAVPNGGSVEVDDEALAFYEKSHGQSFKQAFKKNKSVTITDIPAHTTAAKGVTKDA